MTLARRRAAAEKYRPGSIGLLLVAEAPPCAPERYFYFERVDQHDWLFRYVWEGLTGEKPERGRKPEHLVALRDSGVFLIDLHEENVSGPSLAQLRPLAPGLVERCRRLDPRHIVLIKFSVYDAAFAALADAGLPVIDARLPFPASGQQQKFLSGFRRVCAGAGIEVRTPA
ncbi:MAG TPA: hypothetical protein VFF69_01035 [Phycisphaerales bacterium]|nr:hypothetical protein [Phycisphaerales bacterium]